MLVMSDVMLHEPIISSLLVSTTMYLENVSRVTMSYCNVRVILFVIIVLYVQFKLYTPDLE